MARRGSKASSENNSATAKESADGAGTAALQQRDNGKQDAVALLRDDHRKVEGLFREHKSAASAEKKAELVKQICEELTIHSILEEELFYPACRNGGVEEEVLDEAQVEHDGAKLLVMELQARSPDESYYDAKVAVLSRYVQEHIREEEASDGIFAQAQKHAKQQELNLTDLGQRLQERKAELMQQSSAERLGLVQIRSLDLRSTQQLQQETRMTNRQSNERYRDERGRFESDDDYRRSGGGYRRGEDDDERSYGRGSRAYASRSGRDEDDYGNGRSGRGWQGDPEGHSRASERGWEERGGARYSRRREDDDDQFSSRGGSRGHGGWFGDSEGHARSSEEAWERGRRPGGWFGDSEGHSRVSEEAWERGRRPGGWFGDPEGHSRASERGWEERGGARYSSRGRDEDYDDERRGSGGRGQGGWFGDPEGHSRASERGWEERRGSRGYSSRSREDDQDGGRSRGRGHGGWFGDSEGHSEAARSRSR